MGKAEKMDNLKYQLESELKKHGLEHLTLHAASLNPLLLRDSSATVNLLSSLCPDLHCLLLSRVLTP